MAAAAGGWGSAGEGEGGGACTRQVAGVHLLLPRSKAPAGARVTSLPPPTDLGGSGRGGGLGRGGVGGRGCEGFNCKPAGAGHKRGMLNKLHKLHTGLQQHCSPEARVDEVGWGGGAAGITTANGQQPQL